MINRYHSLHRWLTAFSLSLLMRCKLVLGLGLLLVACSPSGKDMTKAEDKLLIEAGYARGIVLDHPIPQPKNEISLQGVAMPSGRVRFGANGQSYGVPVDRNGRFNANLPMVNGALFLDMAFEDRGRLIQEDGYVLIIDQKEPYVLRLKPGQPAAYMDLQSRSLMIIERSGPSVLAILVQSTPNTKAELNINGQAYVSTSDSQGRLKWLIQGQFDVGALISLRLINANLIKSLNLGKWDSVETNNAQVPRLDQGIEWLVFTWPLPDGGKQETYIGELNIL